MAGLFSRSRAPVRDIGLQQYEPPVMQGGGAPAAPRRGGLFGRMGQAVTPDRMMIAGAALRDLGTGRAGALDQTIQSLQEQAQTQWERQRAEQQDAWQSEQQGRQRSIWGAQDRIAATAPPEQRDLVTADPGAFIQQRGARDQYAWQRNYDNTNPEAITPYQQAQLDLGIRGQNISAANASRAAGAGGQGPGYVRPNGRDAIMGQQYTTALQNGLEALQGLDNLERLFGQLIERDAAGQPLPASARRSLSRIAQTDPESRAILEQIDSQLWPLVLQNLEGLAPVTNVELSQAIQRTVNSDMTPEAIVGEVRRMRAAAQRGVEIGTRASEFGGEAGSYMNGRNAAGQTWAQVLQDAYGASAPRQPDGGPGGGPVTPPAQAIADLRADPNPEARREFEEWFGLPPGGAQQYVPSQPSGARRTILPPRR